jgi:hypothetical protein
MSEAFASANRSRSLLGALVLALTIGALVWTQFANASNPSGYCGGQTLGGRGSCEGAARSFVALEGWGANGSVCVFTYLSGSGVLHNGTCSGGAGQHTYWPFTATGKPGILNNTWNNNLVNGVAWQ